MDVLGSSFSATWVPVCRHLASTTCQDNNGIHETSAVADVGGDGHGGRHGGGLWFMMVAVVVMVEEVVVCFVICACLVSKPN